MARNPPFRRPWRGTGVRNLLIRNVPSVHEDTPGRTECRGRSKGRAWRSSRHRVGGVVGTAHERSGLDVAEAHSQPLAAISGEFFRREVTHDGQVFGGGPKILPQR